MVSDADGANDSRPRGRPRREIDRDAVADVVAELLAEGGVESVSIAQTAHRLSISRATLYRTVPTKSHLLGILLERSAAEMTVTIQRVLAEDSDPAAQLLSLIELQAEAVVRMRHYLPLFFDGEYLPADVHLRWRKWTRQFQRRWADVVNTCMEAGYLEKGDALVSTRLMLGMLLWVCRWYRPTEKITADEIAAKVISLLALPSSKRPPSDQPRRAARRKLA